MNENNLWLSVREYEDLYEVSVTGLIRSAKTKRELRKQLTNSGYHIVHLRRNSKREARYVSHIVFYSFNRDLAWKKGQRKMIIDHKDGNKLNNNINNLQRITQRENISRRSKEYSSKFIGVSKFRNKWRASITDGRKVTYLGVFDEEVDAAQAYEDELAKRTKI